ncbi:MAG: hypothetical protein IJW63_02600 [Lachnospiraceae bacterium]|nr:hypothetical protein [Lachnospiraceae bacterium]
MKKMFLSIKTGHLFGLGLVILFLSLVPTLILGVDSIVDYHDQLDGELIAYILQAKHLFSGNGFFPEFLGGVGQTALTPPAPLAVLLFALFSPFTAYSILQFGVQVTAYVGMFLLANRITGHKYISLMVAVMYAFLPFLPVYGLAHYGIPLLILCFWNLYERKHLKSSYIYIALYTCMSSLILVGFGWLIIGSLFSLYLLITGKWKTHLHNILSTVLMLLIYVTCNLSLIGQILGIGSGFTSHKEEYHIESSSFLKSFWTHLTSNTSHSVDHHIWILFVALGAIIVYLSLKASANDSQRKLFRTLVFTLICILLMYATAALWTTPFIVSLRSNLGALKSFQLTRIMWITPALWYIVLACSLCLLWSDRRWTKWIVCPISIALMLCLGFSCLKTSYLKPNVQKLLYSDYETISWSDYLALGVMDQVENYLFREKDLSISEYKVASLGIDPAAAIYHGFYCIDGYSNNYPLEYKHAFREIIAPELSKSDYLTAYFDQWGNRCYLLSAELYGYYTVEKDSFWYNSLELNTSALKELGCNYILSAAYIVTAEDMNLTLLNQFETQDSYYRIYLYEVN